MLILLVLEQGMDNILLYYRKLYNETMSYYCIGVITDALKSSKVSLFVLARCGISLAEVESSIDVQVWQTTKIQTLSKSELVNDWDAKTS